MRKRILTLVALAVLPFVASAAPASAERPDCVPAASGASAGAASVKVWLAGDSTMADPRSSCPVGWGNEFDALF